MFSETSTYKLSSIFDHKCSHDNKYTRMLPLVVSDQVLRDLQHRKGYKAHGGKFASCIHCRAQWTNEQMVCSYLSNTNKIILPDKDPNIPASYVKEVIPEDRLMTHIIKYQKSNDNSRYAKPVEIINAVYNNHVSCHVRSCFKCQGVKKKRKHICGEKCECRYHFPDKGRPNALVRYIKDGGVRWFSWNGSEYLQPLVEFLPKRNCYDLFQNVCCPAISHSKLTCNSNIALITDGPLSQYQFKYQLKKTQKEDTMDYEDCLQSMKSMNGRSHDQDKPEAVRVICRAAFAHNKTNVCAATMASYLIRNGSRFYFSHKFVFCPLNDLISLQEGRHVGGQATFAKDRVYFENQALHYLCWPKGEEFESLCVKDFYEIFQVKAKTKIGLVKGYDFQADTCFFKHPSFNTKTQKFNQWVVARDEPSYIKVSQWAFPDAASFKGDILTCQQSEFNGKMETYARLVLTLFLPFRKGDDLRSQLHTSFPSL